MKVAILGATRGMGRAVARTFAERGDPLFLLGRDESELARSVADLRARSVEHGSVAPIGSSHCDLAEPDGFAAALEAAAVELDGLDTVVVTAAMFDTQEALEADPMAVRRLLEINFARTIEFCERARERLLAGGGGTLCVFSSVAGDRGRKPIVLYGATKAGLSAYLEGLDHKFHDAGLRVVCVKPGFVKTSMTASLDPPPFAGEPEAVAQRVVAAIDRGTPVVYAPAIWRWILLAIRALPRTVMRRIGF